MDTRYSYKNIILFHLCHFLNNFFHFLFTAEHTLQANPKGTIDA